MKKKALFVVSLCVIALMASGCSSVEVTSSSGVQEQNHTEQNQKQLIEQQPAVSLSWSLERDNINKRTKMWNDPNKISYIYLVSYGKVMSFYTIKGKVSSVNSQVTNTEQLTWKCVNPDGTYATNENCGGWAQHAVEGSVPSPAEDGSYGSNGDAIFFYTTDGAYVEWNGEYMLADQPLKLSTQPELVREIK